MQTEKYLEEINNIMWNTWGVKGHPFGRVEGEKIMQVLNEWAKDTPPPTDQVSADKWISVEDRPLYTKDEKGNWTCTEDGNKEFIAAVPYNDSKKPNENNLWWIRHCVIVDVFGLCVVGDTDNEPAGWQLEDITHWQPLPELPNQ